MDDRCREYRFLSVIVNNHLGRCANQFDLECISISLQTRQEINVKINIFKTEKSFMMVKNVNI